MPTTDYPASPEVQPCAPISSFRWLSSRKSSDSDPPDKGVDNPWSDYQRGSETILLVEDIEGLRQLIAASLEQLGYRVLSASSGEEALAVSAAYSGEIHLLLVDVLMPQMKGPELADKLLGRRPQIKVIYVSGFPPRVLAPYGVLEPGTILLQKPFSIKILAAKLRQALDQ